MRFIPGKQDGLTAKINATHHINEMKAKNYIIISKDAAKALDKIQYLFIIKILNKLHIEEAFLKIIKATHDKPTAKIILNGESQKIFL